MEASASHVRLDVPEVLSDVDVDRLSDGEPDTRTSSRATQDVMHLAGMGVVDEATTTEFQR